MERILGVIPARFASTRFPGKPLIDLNGKPMIQRVWEQARKAKSLWRLLVATDNKKIAAAVKAFGGEAVMTSSDCPTGTDRIAQAAARKACDIVINIQGDEPLLPPGMIDLLAKSLQKDAHAAMATLCHPFKDQAERSNPNAVKVLMDLGGNALYFSRASLPYFRNPGDDSKVVAKHIGLYAYRAWFLKRFCRLTPSPLEKIEGLEQLRALEYGYRIKVSFVQQATQAVDTPEDAKKVRKILKAMEKN